MLLVAVVVTVATVANLCDGRGSRNQENHMATVTWRAGRLAVWFSWKWQILQRLRNRVPMKMQWWQWWTATRVTGMELATEKYFGLGIVCVGSWICIHDLQFFFS